MSWHSSTQEDFLLTIAPGFQRRLFSKGPSWEEVAPFYDNPRTDEIAGLLLDEIHFLDIERAISEKYRHEGELIAEAYEFRVDLQDVGIFTDKTDPTLSKYNVPTLSRYKRVYSLAQFDLSNRQTVLLSAAITLRLLDRLARWWFEIKGVSKSDMRISTKTTIDKVAHSKRGAIASVRLSVAYHVPKQHKMRF